MAITSTAALLTAAALSAAGSISQGRAGKKQAQFEAGIGEQQAGREREIAIAEEGDFRKRQSAVLAERRAAMGGSGVQTGTGTPLLAFEDFATEVELQARRIRAGGETRATRLEQEASLRRVAGRNAQTQGYFRAGSSLLSGYGQTFK